MRLALVGTSHRVAPVEVRERVALGPRQAGELARRLAAGDVEAVCLSTCNRTELYLAGADAERLERSAVEALAGLAGVGEEELGPVLYRLRDEAAALHAFRVAAGLDSLVPGEGEILGQVRAAAEMGAAGPFLDRLFRQALHTGRKVRSQTAIAESPASVSSAAAALAQQVFGELDGCQVLLIGAGKVGQLAARNLVSRGARIGYVASRTPARAKEVAVPFGATALGLGDVAEALATVDVVISSTSAPELVLDAPAVAAAARRRRGRPLFLIDVAVPRDLDPAIHDVDGCFLYDIDDLQAVVGETLAGRRREAVRAEAIVTQEAERFRAWQASLQVVPAIASLRARAEEIRARELARVESRLGRLSEEDRRAVESLTAAIVNKLLHTPTVRMKEAAAAADGGTYVEAVRHLFGLGDDERPSDRLARE
jgi:glutamyl-tRNA reductase